MGFKLLNIYINLGEEVIKMAVRIKLINKISMKQKTSDELRRSNKICN